MLGMGSGGNPQSPQLKKLFLLADEIGLTREERIEYAQFLLRRDVVSWAQLEHSQVLRLLDGLESYQLVTALIDLRA